MSGRNVWPGSFDEWSGFVSRTNSVIRWTIFSRSSNELGRSTNEGWFLLLVIFTTYVLALFAIFADPVYLSSIFRTEVRGSNMVLYAFRKFSSSRFPLSNWMSVLLFLVSVVKDSSSDHAWLCSRRAHGSPRTKGFSPAFLSLFFGFFSSAGHANCQELIVLSSSLEYKGKRTFLKGIDHYFCTEQSASPSVFPPFTPGLSTLIFMLYLQNFTPDWL